MENGRMRRQMRNGDTYLWDAVEDRDVWRKLTMGNGKQ